MWFVFLARRCAMAGLDGTAMAGGGTRTKVPARAKRGRAQVSRQPGYKRRRRSHTDRTTLLSPSTFSGAMSRTLQATWAKLSLAARPGSRGRRRRSARTHVGRRDEAPRRRGGKEGGDARGAGPRTRHETADGWYEAAEEAADEPVDGGPGPANINAAIEKRLADLTRVTKEHEATWRPPPIRRPPRQEGAARYASSPSSHPDALARAARPGGC
ncbi:hypothetical protein QYE76_054318 [Lolium multiflorum]|uniref:Uncharacterized protein n=1 Tax=Lolium multiflorum TaxID=4521 RepID=A0AAD8WKV9_LOLMU|nr:hypothetical protein QYE76_054318 [Lolium multiflorum]